MDQLCLILFGIVKSAFVTFFDESQFWLLIHRGLAPVANHPQASVTWHLPWGHCLNTENT